MLANGLIYLFSFIGVWIGSELAINATEKISKISGISQFIISFLLIGILSSTSELSVGMNALIKNDPGIFVGNLVGASIVIFLFIIPLLAIGGKKIKINKEFRGFHLPAILFVIALPSFFILDGKIRKFDSLIILFFFFVLLISLYGNKSLKKEKKRFIIGLVSMRLNNSLDFFSALSLSLSPEILLLKKPIIFLNYFIPRNLFSVFC